jgi:hypothetical protein
MWSGSNSSRASGGAASMGYAGLVVWVGVAIGGRWSMVGAGFPSLISLPPRSLFISLQIEKKKSGVLLVCDFLAPSLRVNFSLVGKQSLLSATVELKLFSS